MMENTKIEYDEGSHFIVCPLCQYSNLHQEQIDIGFRRTEDHGGIVTRVTRNTAVTTRVDNNNHEAFSSRRDRITIYFSCEECSDSENKDTWIKMHIDQHKGKTYLSWILK